MNSTIEFINYAKHRHDVCANQKYHGYLPYSFHLDTVIAQARKYQYLLSTVEERRLVVLGAAGHDLIEDTRLTYNDIHFSESKEVADIIYACTELRGRNRAERHGQEYFNTLKENRLAVFVKLSDIIANVLFGMLTNSSMLEKYRKEYPKVKEELYREEFKEMFDDLERYLFGVNVLQITE